MIRASLCPTAVLGGGLLSLHWGHDASAHVQSLLAVLFLLCFFLHALIPVAETLPKSEDFSLLVALVELGVLLDEEDACSGLLCIGYVSESYSSDTDASSAPPSTCR